MYFKEVGVITINYLNMLHEYKDIKRFTELSHERSFRTSYHNNDFMSSADRGGQIFIKFCDTNLMNSIVEKLAGGKLKSTTIL